MNCEELKRLILEREQRRLEESLLVAQLNEMADQLDDAIKRSREITGV